MKPLLTDEALRVTKFYPLRLVFPSRTHWTLISCRMGWDIFFAKIVIHVI